MGLDEVKVAIGIDQSLTASGLVAIDIETCEVVHSFVLRSKPGPDRYTKIYEAYIAFFILMVDTLGHEVVQVVRENHAFSSKYGREAMGAAAAIADMAIWDKFNKAAPEVVIQQLKKFAGKGNMKKDEVRLAIYKKWGVEFKSNDECDAYVLARIARGLYVGPADHLAYEQEVLAKIKDNQWAPQQTPTSQSSRSKMDPSSESRTRRVRRRSPEPSPRPSTTATRSGSGRSVRVRSTKR